MANLDAVFSSLRSRIEAVHRAVNPALSDFCADNGFLLTHRHKELRSLYEKLFTARYASVGDVDDLLAYSIVIDVPSQSQMVEKYLRKAFDVQTVRGPQSLFDERFFDFDSKRVICRLGASGDDPSLLNGILFEVQVKTLLQYAWSKITHPLVYKPEKYDAQKSRLAAETLARLEAVDRTFQNFDKISPTVKTVRRREMVGAEKIGNMIASLFDDKILPSELKPTSGRRVSEAIYASIPRSKQQRIDSIVPKMRDFIVSTNPFPRSISIYEICLVFLFKNKLLHLGNEHKPRHYFVSDELRTLFPEIGGLENSVKIAAE